MKLSTTLLFGKPHHNNGMFTRRKNHVKRSHSLNNDDVTFFFPAFPSHLSTGRGISARANLHTHECVCVCGLRGRPRHEPIKLNGCVVELQHTCDKQHHTHTHIHEQGVELVVDQSGRGPSLGSNLSEQHPVKCCFTLWLQWSL